MGCGGLGSAGSAAGLECLKGLFQLKQFCDSMIETATGVRPYTCALQEESSFTYNNKDFF